MVNNHEVILDIIRDINFKNVENFIDLGCDDGTFTLKVAEEVKAKEIYGVDISKEALKKASSNGIKTFYGDLSSFKIPFKDNNFDFILSAGVLEYLINPDNMLREVYRVLKPGKYFIVEIFHSLGSWTNRFSLLLGYQPFGCFVSTEFPHSGKLFQKELKSAFPKQVYGQPLRSFTLMAIKELLAFHGFKTVKVRGACGIFPKNKIFRMIDRLFSKRASWARRVIILAIKPKVEERKLE